MSTLNCDKIISSTTPPDWTSFIPAREYHAASRSGKVVSSGMLKEFRACPAQYHALVTGRARPRESDALRFGRAAHVLLLEGEAAFHAAFTIGGPVNPKTGRAYAPGSKVFAQWLRDSGMDLQTVVTPTEVAVMRRMAGAIRAHPEASRLLRDGWAERTARAEMLGLPCQIRVDWLRGDGVAVDLKTVDNIARFETAARRFGYLHQFAFYREVARAAGGGEIDIAAVVVEKRPPFRVGVWRFPPDSLAPYALQNRTALEELRQCRERGRWPTGYEKPRLYPLAGIPRCWLN